MMSASVGFGAFLGWFNDKRRKQAASAALAAAISCAPVAANAYVDFDGIKYLGASDKVDVNNASVRAYRQFPGMYPKAAGFIATHGPYDAVQDIYKIPDLPDKVKELFQKYEGNLVCFPPNPAYFLDRSNDGIYK
uniref:Photosystem II 12 kDa extrinsic protein n=1 Tax=Polykrikos lebourae TaxID=370573 RepID=A0A0K0TN22_9DINO|nr:photosystem II 12 kDa extrinsic protein [Polykrikos lebourae]